MLDAIEICSTKSSFNAKGHPKKSFPKPVRGKRGSEQGLALGGPFKTCPERDVSTGKVGISKLRFDTVMKAAQRAGLLEEKSSRISGRVSPALVKQAKKQACIETDTDLIAFALANIALEDNFAEVFRKSRRKVDAELKLGF